MNILVFVLQGSSHSFTFEHSENPSIFVAPHSKSDFFFFFKLESNNILPFQRGPSGYSLTVHLRKKNCRCSFSVFKLELNATKLHPHASLFKGPVCEI